jgi:hypothetical protein
MQVLQLLWVLQFALYRFSSLECLHCLHPSFVNLISYSALSSPFAVLQTCLVQTVFTFFDG